MDTRMQDLGLLLAGMVATADPTEVNDFLLKLLEWANSRPAKAQRVFAVGALREMRARLLDDSAP